MILQNNILKIIGNVFVRIVLGKHLPQQAIGLDFGNHKKTGEYNFINLIKKDLKICIDIGANVGSYAKEILMMTDAKVIAIEPLSGAFEKLKKLENNIGFNEAPIKKGSNERLKFFNLFLIIITFILTSKSFICF